MRTERKYLVTTEDKEQRVIKFLELDHPNHYGNGKLIYIQNLKTKDNNVIDVRYQKYNFQTICENWIKDYYGENLLFYEMQN